MLAFAIKPSVFVDDGEEAYHALKAKMAAEKAAAKRAGVSSADDDEE